MPDMPEMLKLAAAQAAPVFLDREATTAKACDLIREAGRNGAHVIGFPEGFIPAHPHWFHFMGVSRPKAVALSAELFRQSVEIPGPVTEALGRACREAGVVCVVGVCERRPRTKASMWNTQVFIDSDGRLLGKHQKIMPTWGERIVHAHGHGDTLKAYETAIGPVSGLVCGENNNPLCQFAMAAAHPVVHVAAWPAYFNAQTNMMSAVEVAGRALGYTLGAFVINAAGVVTEEMIEAYAETDEDRAFMRRVGDESASLIVGPGGTVIAGPPPPGEGILYAEVETADLHCAGVGKDYAGHYNRFDIFELSIRRGSPTPIVGEEPVAETVAMEEATEGE